MASFIVEGSTIPENVGQTCSQECKPDREDCHNSGHDDKFDGQDNPTSSTDYKPDGQDSHANGADGKPDGLDNHTSSTDDKPDEQDSHTSGIDDKRDGQDSHTNGTDDKPDGQGSHTFCADEKPDAQDGHTSGADDKRDGQDIRTSGIYDKLEGKDGHTNGADDKSDGQNSHTSGINDKLDGQDDQTNNIDNKPDEQDSHTSGIESKPHRHNSHASRADDTPDEQDSHTSGIDDKLAEQCNHTSGIDDKPIGQDSHASGIDETLDGKDCQTSGIDDKLDGQNSHTSDHDDKFDGQDRHTSDIDNKLDGQDGHINGIDDKPDGHGSLANGRDDKPDGQCSLAKGIDGKPDGQGSLANGIAEEHTVTKKVDRFGFTGGNQFEETRDSHLPVSVIRKRELKWLDMLEDWSKWMSKKPKKVKERCRKGIPSSLRARAWQYLSGSKNVMEKKKLVFAELDAQDGDPKWVDLIEKDLDRQFPFHEMFAKGGGGQHDLFRILKAYSIYNPRDGYCQAQAPIAAVLVMQMPAEEAFWCLVQICEKYLVGYFSPGLEAMQIDGDVLLGLMKRHLTATYHHMVEQNLEPVHYMTEWFMCIYSRTFPFATVLRVWDIFLCEGVKVLFKVALVIIKHSLSSRRQLEECPGFYETIQKLKHIPSDIVEEDFLINEVVEMRVFEKEFEAEHSLQVARRNAMKQRQLRHSNQVQMAKQVAEIKQKKKIKAKSKIQLKKPLSQSQGALDYISSDQIDSFDAYSLPNTPSQRRWAEKGNIQQYSQSDTSTYQSKFNGAKANSADELEYDGYLGGEGTNQTDTGLNGKKAVEKVKKEKKKSKDKKKTKIK